MLKTKVIAFDVYGTILCADDSENAMPVRQGFANFVWRAKKSAIRVVTSSDANLDLLKLDLLATSKNRAPYGLDIFDGFFRLEMRPKNYTEILRYFSIKPDELMIIGDQPENDFAGAPTDSIKLLVPKYQMSNDRFDFSDLEIS